MIKKKVLVFPCGSEIALEIYRAMCYDIHFELWGASSVSDHGKFVYEKYIENVPSVDDPDFIEAINKIVDQHGIDLIYPAHDSVVLTLSQNVQKLHCKVVAPDVEVCEISRSKKKTYELLADVVPVPKMYDSRNIPEFPVFLKPDVGQGAKGCLKAFSQNEIIAALQNNPSLLVLEYLPGKEYTIDCFSDNEGNLLFVQGRERHRISNGISVNSVPVKHADFERYAQAINKVVPFHGTWFFQVKERKSGELVLMEIAPRVAGTMALARMQGVNLALMNCYNALGLSVSVLQNKYSVEIDRALENKFKIDCVFDTVYVDLDDCIIIDAKVNVSMIAFLYNALNKGKKIVLLSKHNKDIVDTLKKYRLDNLFDEVIHINQNDHKYSYIKSVNSIFIDDSFAERKEVAENIGISVFSPDMISELM